MSEKQSSQAKWKMANPQAVWLAANWFKAERPLLPFLRKRFGLSPHEAVEAARIRKGKGAHQ
ncbi:hypothetical protein [Mesorhizobium sp.]|uniref:hypothetical protein n=1 Tax=Mesorhizobium sp. TaxID=1871066 RepID=UPI000FE355C2|nr:hypothetical protein [Mesorhizobium sp.]RWN99528.1 MAG: hypothetical protein EOS06_16425 [Mesorhizobium sp.]RWO54826.1 MAG: hypothetical protein EOS13_06625 [Mesorhizobium sp.]TIN24790.1 MAG: hypothetical protein E5Y19_20685 [Mesorhizobium sp.]TIN40124.1 MAG: hypothetical protein E5Y13_09800 [Mesorhizobium sp.]TJU90905.1 MAG: hypothetical protein E5Y10_10945 [Mesorhizobium sp.]